MLSSMFAASFGYETFELKLNGSRWDPLALLADGT